MEKTGRLFVGKSLEGNPRQHKTPGRRGAINDPTPGTTAHLKMWKDSLRSAAKILSPFTCLKPAACCARRASPVRGPFGEGGSGVLKMAALLLFSLDTTSSDMYINIYIATEDMTNVVIKIDHVNLGLIPRLWAEYWRLLPSQVFPNQTYDEMHVSYSGGRVKDLLLIGCGRSRSQADLGVSPPHFVKRQMTDSEYFRWVRLVIDRIGEGGQNFSLAPTLGPESRAMWMDEIHFAPQKTLNHESPVNGVKTDGFPWIQSGFNMEFLQSLVNTLFDLRFSFGQNGTAAEPTDTSRMHES